MHSVLSREEVAGLALLEAAVPAWPSIAPQALAVNRVLDGAAAQVNPYPSCYHY